MKRWPIALALVGLAGCAQVYWVHPSKSVQEFHADNADCLAMASGSTGNAQILPDSAGGTSSYNRGYRQGWNQAEAETVASNRHEIHNSCLRGRGWYTVTK